MNRRLYKLVLFLFLGAIVNVAVAWGCVMWSPFRTSTLLDNEVSVLVLKSHGLDSYAPYKLFSNSSVGFGIRRIVVYGWNMASMSSPLDELVIMFYDSGFPMLCMTGRYEISLTSDEVNYFTLIDPSSNLSKGSLRPRWLIPLRPVWPGFIVNTVIYAVLLWLLTLAPFTARRMIRHKQGRCIKCGYDLRGTEHDVCPECGWERESEA